MTARFEHMPATDVDARVVFQWLAGEQFLTERWTVPMSGSIGLVQYHIRRLGFALVWGSSRNGRLALVVFPALLLGVYELVRIWRPKGNRSGAVAG